MEKKYALYTMVTPNYVIPSLTMIYSFIENNSWFDGDIVILSKDLTKQDKSKFYCFYEKMRFVDYDAKIFDKIIEMAAPYTYDVLKYAYYKLEIFRDLEKQDYDFCVFVDSDVLILKNTFEMFNNNFNLAWCEDVLCEIYSKRNNIDYSNQYFNTGVFTLNCAYMKNFHMWDRIVDYFKNYNPETSHINVFTEAQKLLYADQCVINDLAMKMDNTGIYDKNIYNKKAWECTNEELNSVKILHFMNEKPWKIEPSDIKKTSQYIWFYYYYKVKNILDER